MASSTSSTFSTFSTIPVAEDALRHFSKTVHLNSKTQNETLTANWDLTIDAFIKTAYDAEIDGNHRAAATNAICSAVGHALKIRTSRPITKDQWLDVLTVVLDRSDSAKGKSMRQLLIAMVKTLPSLDQHDGTLIRNETLQLVFKILLSQQSDHVKVKPAFQVVSIFLTKQAVNLEDFVSQLRIFMVIDLDKDSAARSDREILQRFAEALMNWMRFTDSAPAAGQTVCALTKMVASEQKCLVQKSDKVSEAFWIHPLMTSFSAFPEAIAHFRHHLLPGLLALDSSTCKDLLEALRIAEWLKGERVPRTQLLYTSLLVGKEMGIVLEAVRGGQVTGEIAFKDGKVLIMDKAWARLLRDFSSDTRIAGFSLLISSAAVTRPFSSNIINCLKRNLSHLLMEVDAGKRGEILTGIQRIVDRVKAATSVLYKTINQAQFKPPAFLEAEQATIDSRRKTLAQHQAFISWLITFFRQQLHPEAGYQRHITSLRAMVLIASSGVDNTVASCRLSKSATGDTTWCFHIQIYDSWMARVLYDLTMNPFEDVRIFAETLIDLTVPHDLHNTLAQQDPITVSPGHASTNLNVLLRAERLMLRSGRADHADGVSRTYALLFESVEDFVSGSDIDGKEVWWSSKSDIIEHLVGQLETALSTAAVDLKLAVTLSPIHGTLASIRYILDMPIVYASLESGDSDWKSRWTKMHSVLVLALQRVWTCVRSILCNDAPEGYVPNETAEEENMTTKDILSYSWRALKEASAIIQVLARKAPVGAQGLLNEKDFVAMCSTVFMELSELRHRGAFSAVAQAFAACCSRCHQLGHHELLNRFYKDTLACIQYQASATTRRSAGLPSLITGILGADPGGSLFQQAIKDLQSEAVAAPPLASSYGDELPQVHALNSLRAVFTSTVLGPSSEPYLVSTLGIAGRCLRSQIWAIRNCGAMLFRAVIDRLLGSTDSQNHDDDGEFKTARITYNDYPKLLDIITELLRPASDAFERIDGALESVFPALKIIQRMPPPEHEQKRLVLLQTWSLEQNWIRSCAIWPPFREVTKMLSMVDCSVLIISWIRSSIAQGSLFDLEPIYDVLRRQVDVLYRDNPSPYTRSAYLDILNRFTLALITSPHLLENSALFNRIAAEEVTTVDQNDRDADSEVAEIFYEEPSARKSVALHFLLHYILRMQIVERRGQGRMETLDHYQIILTRLESGDSDAKMQVLEYLVDISTCLPQVAVHLLVGTVVRLTENSENNRVASRCRRFLRNLYMNVTKDPDLFVNAPSLPNLRGVFKRKTVAAPSMVVNTLRLWGFIMNRACQVTQPTYVLAKEILFMLSFIAQMLQETRTFELRQAAALCLKDAPEIWTVSIARQDLTPQRIQAILLAYDILNDDDEEVRDIGSQIVSIITKKDVCAPLVASQQLLQYLATQYRQSEHVCKHALRRMTQSTLLNDRLLPSAKERFMSATAEDTALFVVEKQNLFLDLYHEAGLWSQVLKGLSAKIITDAEVTALGDWVFDGLTLLSDKAHHELDGPLGWTSKREVWVFGMQVLFGAEVYLDWRLRTKKGGVEGKVIRDLLARLYGRGTKTQVHGAWLEKVQNILVDAIGTKVGSFGALFKTIEADKSRPEGGWTVEDN
ncbi:HEAT repeat protein-like protein [Venturia nashicola]|uniref:HEAT repeat protein-like protein n=1 Tax=Venturia nashicola TaxID=86259 RepID=A0A4Z1NUA2_9PEZI|nr:HEAT repeat protein-like protein [Venturia nashicola]